MLSIVYVAIAVYLFATTLATSGHLAMKMHADHNKAVKNETQVKSQFSKYRFLYASIVLYVLAGMIDLSVNRLIPFYVRAIFAALDIPLYVVMARVALNETLDGKQTVGVLLSLIGCVCAVAFSTHAVPARTKIELMNDLLSYRVGVMVSITVPLFVACVHFVRDAVNRGSELVENNRMFLLTCAVFSSSFTATWASVLVRIVSELIHFSIVDTATLSAGVILVLMSIAQLATMGDMHALFKSVVSMPFYLVLNAAGIVLLSSIIFNEVPDNTHFFAVSMLFGFLGIALIVHKAPDEMSDNPIEDSSDLEENQALIHVRE